MRSFSREWLHRGSVTADLRVWHTDVGCVEVVVHFAAHRAAGVAGEAHGVRDGGLRRPLVEVALHALVVLSLHLHTLLDASLGLAERPVLQLAHQLGVEDRLLGGDGVQVAHAVHVALGGGHVQRGVVVVVQAPHVGTEAHQEGEAVVVAIGSGQVERCVAPYVTLVWVAPTRQDKENR